MGLTPQEAKIKALHAIPHPKNVDELRVVLGKLRYYGCFCPGFSAIARPMLDLLKKGAAWTWTKELQGAAFDHIRDEISKPGRALMRFDASKPIFIHCDFSNVGLGAVLSQHNAEGQECMIACCSRSLNKHETNYSSYKGECLAAVWACRLFRNYTQGLHFTLVTDHEPLKWLMSSQTLEGAHARWACILQEHDFEIMHRPGTQSGNVDALSRFPIQDDKDTTGARLDHDHQVVTAVLGSPPMEPHTGVHRNIAAAILKDSPPETNVHPIKTIGPPDALGVFQTVSLNTTPQPTAWAVAAREGVTLYEPFGGLCAGLEAVLRNGIRVHKYFYSDICVAAQRVATHRLERLRVQYPKLLSAKAKEGAFQLPMDVYKLNSQLLADAGARDGTQWLVIAGPECKDFSPAGSNKGSAGHHSRTLRACIQIVGTLQQLQQAKPPLYVIENAAMQHNFRSATIRDVDFPAICKDIGVPVMIDAARFGAYAHRCRNFWTNLENPQILEMTVQTIHRSKGILVEDILDPGRHTAEVARSDSHPFYPANILGQPRSALPTLMAYTMSRAFHIGMPGAIYDSTLGTWGEPNPEERERALGYETGATKAPDVTAKQRHEVTGNCMDQAALTGLLRCSLLTAMGGPSQLQHQQYQPVFPMFLSLPALPLPVIRARRLGHSSWF